MNIHRATIRATIMLLLSSIPALLPRQVLAQQTNSGFSQVVVSNQATFDIVAQFLDQQSGLPRNTQLPPGTMCLVTSTNLQTPVPQWTPIGNTNGITNSTLSAPLNNTGLAFFKILAQPDTNIDLSNIPPYDLVAVPPAPLVSKAVTLGWTNSNAVDIMDLLLVSDGKGHLYSLRSMLTPSGLHQSFHFNLQSTNGVQFVRYSVTAATGDYFFLPTNYFQNPDLITVPYVIIPDPSRSAIMQVAAYDMTDTSNPQLLAQITGDGCTNGTLEIPGMALAAGNRTLEFQVTDTSFGTTVTDFAVTVADVVGISFPVLTIEDDGVDRVLAGTAGSAIAIEATTTATNGSWYITEYDGPSGTQLQQVQVPVASTGGTLMYNDGGEPPGGYTNEWFEFTVTVGSSPPPSSPPLPPAAPAAPPAFALKVPPPIPLSNRFKYWPSHPRQPAGEITCYDHTALPSANFDKQYAITAMQTVATMASFTCFPVDFPSGVYTVVNGSSSPPITSLNQESVWGWEAMNGSLAKASYQIYLGTNYQTQVPSLPINIFFINGHGGTNGAGVAVGIQGPADNYQLSQDTLAQYQFNPKTNGLALAVFASCRIGSGPFINYVLRNNGVPGQINAQARQAKGIRWCWGLGWNQDKVQDYRLYDFVAWWAYYAAYLNSGNSFQYSFDEAIQQALNSTSGNGGDGVVWTGCQGMTLDETVP